MLKGKPKVRVLAVFFLMSMALFALSAGAQTDEGPRVDFAPDESNEPSGTLVTCGKPISWGNGPKISQCPPLPEGYNGITLDPPPSTYSTAMHDGKKIQAVYSWVHVGTMINGRGSGAFSHTFESQTTESEFRTRSFAISLGLEATAGVAGVSATLSTAFDYDSTQKNAHLNYNAESVTARYQLSPGTPDKVMAVQVWQLKSEYVTEEGVRMPFRNQHLSQVTYTGIDPKDAKIRLLGTDLPIPKPPYVSNETTHFPPVPKPVSMTREVPGYNNILEAQIDAVHQVFDVKYDLLLDAWGDCPKRGIRPGDGYVHTHYFDNHVRDWRDRCNLKLSDSYPSAVFIGLVQRREPKDKAIWLDCYCTRGWHSYVSWEDFSEYSKSFCRAKLNPCHNDPNKEPCRYWVRESTPNAWVHESCHAIAVLSGGGNPDVLGGRDAMPKNKVDVTYQFESKPTETLTTKGGKNTVHTEVGVEDQQEEIDTFAQSIGVGTTVEGKYGLVDLSAKVTASLAWSHSEGYGLGYRQTSKREYETTYEGCGSIQPWQLSVTYKAHDGGAELTDVSNVMIFNDDTTPEKCAPTKAQTE